MANDLKDAGGRWLTLGRARQLLGVNETTLRHWADSGRVRAFRTPGGHRRFASEDLYALTQPPAPSTGFRASGDWSHLALRRIRRRLQQRRPQPQRWHQGFDDEGVAKMRVTGRRLLSLAGDYLAKRRRRSEILEEARFIGQEYGREMATRGMPLAEAVRAFIFFRDAFRDAFSQSARGLHQPGDSAIAAWNEVATLADEVLIAMVESYERS